MNKNIFIFTAFLLYSAKSMLYINFMCKISNKAKFTQQIEREIVTRENID